MGIGDDIEYPETVHEYTGQQAKPAHDPDLFNDRAIVGKDLNHNVYNFVEDDPDGVDHQAPVYLGVHGVQEEAADDDGNERQEEDNTGSPADDELPDQDTGTPGLQVIVIAVVAPYVLLFEDEVHVGGHDGKDP